MRSLAAALILLLVVRAEAQLDLDGYVKGFLFSNIHSGELERLGTRLQTRYAGSLTDRLGVFAAVNFESDLGALAADSTGEKFDIFPVEFYLDYRTRAVDFRVGRQLIFWGVSDWVSPMDMINPWDHSRLSGEIEDYRLSVMAAKATAYAGDLQLEGVIIPAFEPVELPLPPGTEIILPEKILANSQVGLRLTSYLGMTDVSLTAFSGYEAWPDIGQNMATMGMTAEYLRYQLLGVDAVHPVGSFALKGEAAYLRRSDEDGNDPFLRNSQLRTVAGVEYSPTDRLSLSAQGSLDAYLDYDEDEEAENIAARGLSMMLEPEPATTTTASLMVNWQAGDYVTLQLMGLHNLEDQDGLYLAFASWDIADGFQALIGTILFEGPEGSLFGRLDRQDKIFLELKASF